MVVRIMFDTGNDAFVGRRKEEICRVLRDAIKWIKEMDHVGRGGFSLRDVNGNHIGLCKLSDE